jgi:hypothetical protein
MSAERSRTAARNGQQHFDMPPTDPLAVSLDEGSSSSADEIGNLERRRGHWSTSSPIVTHTYIKTAGQSLLRSLMRSVRRRAATSNAVIAEVGTVSNFSDFRTNQDLTRSECPAS